MGTAANPIASGVTARLLITDNGPIDRTWDPFGISRGLISHGSVSIHGAEVELLCGTGDSRDCRRTNLALKTIPVGWKVGDSIVIAPQPWERHRTRPVISWQSPEIP